MSQQQILELAKQGNAQAIATLMNHQFQPKGILVKANSVEGCLQVIFEAEEAPQQQKLVSYTQTAINKLNCPFIEKLIIYGKVTGEDFPVWQEEINLSKSENFDIKQPNQESLDKNKKEDKVISKPVEPNKNKELIASAQSGDIHALSKLIEQKFTSKVVVTPRKQGTLLVLTVKFSEKTDSQTALKIITEILNEIKPKNIKVIQVIGVRLWTEWAKYLTLVSGSYIDSTKSMYTTMTVMLILFISYVFYANFIYKPAQITASTASTSTSTISSPPSSQTRVSLGMSKTGYELLLEGSCVIVKDIKTSDFARLNTTLEGFKNAVKQETGYQCVLFE